MGRVARVGIPRANRETRQRCAAPRASHGERNSPFGRVETARCWAPNGKTVQRCGAAHGALLGPAGLARYAGGRARWVRRPGLGLWHGDATQSRTRDGSIFVVSAAHRRLKVNGEAKVILRVGRHAVVADERVGETEHLHRHGGQGSAHCSGRAEMDQRPAARARCRGLPARAAGSGAAAEWRGRALACPR